MAVDISIKVNGRGSFAKWIQERAMGNSAVGVEWKWLGNIDGKTGDWRSAGRLRTERLLI